MKRRQQPPFDRPIRLSRQRSLEDSCQRGQNTPKVVEPVEEEEEEEEYLHC
jgi:hypothetical protein